MKKSICLILCVSILLSLFSVSLSADTADFLSIIRAEYINKSSPKETVFENIEYEKTGYTYSKYEIRFGLNLDYTNPFNPDDITVNAEQSTIFNDLQ